MIKAKRDQKLLLNSNLAIKQIEAAENVWSIFEPTSVSIGENKIIRKEVDKFFLSKENAESFAHEMNRIFNGKSGLYFPMNFRHDYHGFRDFIISELLSVSGDNIEINRDLVNRFKKKRKKLRLGIRKIIGDTNLLIIGDIQSS